jgi:hypothetical protein
VSNVVLFVGVLLIWGLYALVGRRYTSVIPTVPLVPLGLLVVGAPLNLWIPWLGTILIAVFHVPIGVLMRRDIGPSDRRPPSNGGEDHRA